MAKGHKPVAGSRAYWPKKRAKRIYGSFKSFQGKGLEGFAGYKVGMTQVSVIDSGKGSNQGKEVFKPATVLAVPDLVVFGVKAYTQTPSGLRDSGVLLAEKLSRDLKRKTSVPKSPGKKSPEGDEYRILVHTKPREAFGKKRPEIFEIPVESLEAGKSRLGKELKASEVFKEGEFIDVRSVTKGKGYQGPVKRFGVVIRSRKAHKKRRHIGVLAPRNVARVLPNSVAMAGQLGFQTRTEYNKQILKISDGSLTPKGGWVNYGELKGDYMIVSGSVPGPRKRLVMLRKGLRAKPEARPEVKEIVLDSQQ